MAEIKQRNVTKSSIVHGKERNMYESEFTSAYPAINDYKVPNQNFNNRRKINIGYGHKYMPYTAA